MADLVLKASLTDANDGTAFVNEDDRRISLARKYSRFGAGQNLCPMHVLLLIRVQLLHALLVAQVGDELTLVHGHTLGDILNRNPLNQGCPKLVDESRALDNAENPGCPGRIIGVTDAA